MKVYRILAAYESRICGNDYRYHTTQDAQAVINAAQALGSGSKDEQPIYTIQEIEGG